MDKDSRIRHVTPIEPAVDIEKVFAHLTMALEDAAGLAADGQTQDNLAERNTFVRA